MHTTEGTQGVRPRIGVPARLTSSDNPDARVGEANKLMVAIVELLREAGAEPVVLAPGSTVPTSSLHGMLLPGGGDVDPGLYGQEPGPALYDVNQEQDRLDVEAARAALDAGLPLLGICRGHQLLNGLYGGTLIQDLEPSEVRHNGFSPDDPDGEWAWHGVMVSPGSKAATLYGEPDGAAIKIASGHHQAVDVVGEGLVVTAVADDGTVEALEDPKRWVASVQWHPEAPHVPHDERLVPFKAFVEVCRSTIQNVAEGVS